MPDIGDAGGASDLRVALFSGNYNCVRDGANQTLNRLAAYLLAQGAQLRVYSPTVQSPAFPATGDLVSVPSFAFPLGRSEYRFSYRLPDSVKADILGFSPNVFHVSAPDVLCHRAVSMAKARDLPVMASMHTLFETYPAYYGMGFLEQPIVAMLRRFYNRCDAVVAPTEEIAERLRGQGVVKPVSVWSRGVDHARFHPSRRDLVWRRSLGIGDDDIAVSFLGRLVLEKGLDVLADVSRELSRRGVAHKLLIIGDGPARAQLIEWVPDAVMAGFLAGDALDRAVASMDIFLNPSTTETFGNVTLEAMASGVVVVAADATGARTLVEHGITGQLIASRDVAGYADAVQHYIENRAALAAAGAAGHLAAKAYDWDSINQKVVEAYRLAIQQRRGR